MDDTVNGSVESVKQNGKIISIVRLPESGLVKEKNIFIHGFLYTPNGKQLSEIARLMQDGIVKPELAKVLPLSKAGVKAHSLLEQGHTRGKVVLDFSDLALAEKGKSV